MITLNKVSFRYTGASQASLKDIDLRIIPGECVLLTGKSGCGKTTLTRVLNGLCPKFYEGTFRGKYLLQGKDTAEAPLDEMGRELGSVFQDPRSQFFAKRVRDEIVLAMENHCLDRGTMRDQLRKVCDSLNLEHLLDKDMMDLSSGEKQKIAIASVCALCPKGLVLDEPSANLDSQATTRLANFLREFKEQGHTIIISEHRLHYLADIFDRMIVMEEGRITAQYTREEALALGANELEEMGLRLFSLPILKTSKRLKGKEESSLRAEEVSYSNSGLNILQDVNMGTHAGGIVAITGGNGAGKTSLCRILSGIAKETTGIVSVDGIPAGKRQRIKHSFFVQQDVDYQLYTPSVAEEIVLGTKILPEEIDKEAILDPLSLSTVLDQHPNTLSGGQKQRVLLAAALIRSIPTLIVDEPTSGLDGHHMRVTARLLRAIAEQGRNVLLITHDVELIALAADALIYIESGKIKYQHRVLCELA